MSEYVFEVPIVVCIKAGSEEAAREWAAENLMEQVQQMEIAPEDFDVVESREGSV